MLQTLTIKNYAIIQSLKIDFQTGFSVITGETGAGKSILLGALGLLLGNRADKSALKEQNEKCVVEAIFDIAEFDLEKTFIQEELDYFDSCIMRREISTQGRSRAFINDIPVSLNLLKKIGLKIMDIHSQNQNNELRDPKYHLKTLDVFAKNNLKNYKALFKIFQEKQKQLEDLTQQKKTRLAEYEYWQHNFNELEKAKLQADEQQELEQKSKFLENAVDIKSAYQEAYQSITGDDLSAIHQLINTLNALRNIEKIMSEAGTYKERIKTCEIELNDIASELETQAEEIEYNPEEANAVNERLHLIYSLQKKHQVNSVEELIELKQNLETKLSEIASYDDNIQDLKTEIDKIKTSLIEQANILHESRKSGASKLQTEVQKLLEKLGMPNAIFSIKIDQLNDLINTGLDAVEFMFAGNKNNTLNNIAKVASGGEISRLMLSLKAIIAKSVKLPTIIFDEIDTGISGDIADKAGNIMKQMSQKIQVIDITHLPQIAAKADHQYIVFKTDTDTGAKTDMKKLTSQERVNQIAKMLSGQKITEAAVKNAKELLSMQDAG